MAMLEKRDAVAPPTVASELQRLGLPLTIDGLTDTIASLRVAEPASWVIDENSRTGWVNCGGEALIRIPLAVVGRNVVYVVRDDNDGRAWETETRENCGVPRRPRPAARLAVRLSA